MNSEPDPYRPLQQPAPGKSARRVPRLAVAVGTTAFLGLAGAGVAFAVGGSGTPVPSLSSATSSTTQPKSPPQRPKKVGGALGRFGMGLGGGRVLHGEYTVDEGGTYKTIMIQTGKVTAKAADGSSFTVQSVDSTSESYVVQPSTIVNSQAGGISTVAVTDTVYVQALVQGSSHTATRIIDITKIGSSRKGFGLEPPGGGGGAGAAQRGPLPPAAAET